jgi:hypothetical protein
MIRTFPAIGPDPRRPRLAPRARSLSEAAAFPFLRYTADDSDIRNPRLSLLYYISHFLEHCRNYLPFNYL